MLYCFTMDAKERNWPIYTWTTPLTTRSNRKCNSIMGFLIPIPHVGEIKFRGLDAWVLQNNYVRLYNVSFPGLVLTYCRAPSRLPYFIATVNIQLILKNCLYQIKKAEIPLLGEAFLILCYKCNRTVALTLLLTQRLFQVRVSELLTLVCLSCVGTCVRGAFRRLPTFELAEVTWW